MAPKKYKPVVAIFVSGNPESEKTFKQNALRLHFRWKCQVKHLGIPIGIEGLRLYATETNSAMILLEPYFNK